MTGLGLLIFAAGFTLLYSGIRAQDPRCLLQRVFDPAKECPRIDAGEADPAAGVGTATAPTGGAVTPGGGAVLPGSAANAAKANSVYLALKLRYPLLRYGGICNCRHRRGTGADTSQWSVHSICGAVDVWTDGHYSNNEVIAFAKKIPGVYDAYLDASPGDIHVQVVPNPPQGWIQPCAGTAGPQGQT